MYKKLLPLWIAAVMGGCATPAMLPDPAVDMDGAAPDHAKHKDTGRRRDIGSLRDRQHRPHPARRVGRDHLRSREDSGTQYRSAIFYKDAEQKRNAEAYIKQLSAAQVFNRPIATEVTALKRFFPAEEYHQQFVKRNPD